MKTKIAVLIITSLLIFSASCKKHKNGPAPDNPIPPANEVEVMTTFKIVLTDSASGAVSSYMFKDPDGDGGIAGFYGPGTTSTSTQADSVINLAANKTYFASIILLDETKNPVDSVSNSIKNESKDHMFFYDNVSNTIISAANPYTVKLNGSNIVISYSDLDSGSPARGIGLKTKWRTSVATSIKQAFNITLRHQPGVKDGTYAPGETDISVNFKIKVN